MYYEYPAKNGTILGLHLLLFSATILRQGNIMRYQLRPENLFNLEVLSKAIRSAAGGTFFHACFITSKGKRREMTCRLGVKRYLVNTPVPASEYKARPFNGTLTVWDATVKDYRTIPLKRLESVTIKGTRHTMEVR